MVTKDFEIVKGSLKVTVYSNKDHVESISRSVRKIGPNWIEFNSEHDRMYLNPETNRLEDYTAKYDLLEYINESIEEIRQLHEQVKTFKVGDGVHYSYGSDTYSGTVIEVRKGIVIVQDDETIAYHRDIHSEQQEYDFVVNPNGATKEFRRKRDGYYSPKGDKYPTLYHGRAHYYDPHF